MPMLVHLIGSIRAIGSSRWCSRANSGEDWSHLRMIIVLLKHLPVQKGSISKPPLLMVLTIINRLLQEVPLLGNRE